MQELTRLYLVSCAETSLDPERVFQGGTDHQLTGQGIRHARLLSKRLRDKRIDSFYSSPFPGAFKTASILAAGHRRGVIRLSDLREMDFGEWSGSSVDDLNESDEELLHTWRFQPHQHRMPGGESLEEVQLRVVVALEKTLSVEKGNAVCVVTHVIPVKAAMCHFMNEDLSMIWLTHRQESTALNIIDFENDEAEVVTVGSLDHLGEQARTELE